MECLLALRRVISLCSSLLDRFNSPPWARARRVKSKKKRYIVSLDGIFDGTKDEDENNLSVPL